MRRGIEPELYSYLSFREYLGDWYAARKAADTRFSHRLFARRAGVTSPSLLNEVIGGRRNLTPRTLEGFVKALELDDEAAAFFSALVDLDQAVTDEERNQAFQRVESSRRFRGARRIEGAAFRYLSNWFYPAIRELALCDGFQADPEWIRKQLQPAITAAQAREALEALFELGMLVETDGVVTAAEVSVATPHKVRGLAANNYHKQMLERASDSVEGASPDERHLLGVTVAIPEALVPELKRELNAMQERLLHMCDAAVENADRVYQVHLVWCP